MRIRQDVDLYSAILDNGDSVDVSLAEGRIAWVQMARGSAKINGEQLSPGDGAAISAESAIALEATSEAEILVFDMA